ncbi:MAG: hypothetical protein LUG60_14850 [Erysipelotrichaceae bacterium]|nr:hypothetical protein [Erysipelotrichaceae bacterium]
MIKTKDDLKLYLEQDKEQLGKTYSKPHVFGDEIWKFQIYLRKLEYYTNSSVGGGDNTHYNEKIFFF